jgi:hypothetical protein
MKNEKYYLKKYRLLICSLLIICISFMAVVYLNVESNTVMMLCCIVIALVGFFATRIIIRKVILSVLMDDLNAPLFRKIVKKGKFAGLQLWSEYYCGNFGNVVELCRKKLADPKAAKKGRYMYLGRLAAVYYAMGDSESLQAVCQEVEEYLKTEKPSVKGKQAAYIKLFDFYNAYLAGDWETCEKLEERQTKSNLDRMAGVNSQARLALAKGDVDRAKELFEEARQAPNLCYAACAEEGLRAIEEGTPYGEGLEPLATTEDFSVIYPAKVIKFFRCAGIVCCVLAVILLWVSAGLELVERREAERAKEAQNRQEKELDLQKFEQLQQDREEYEQYKEKLRVLVEKDYDNVEVLSAVNFVNEGKWLDSLFLFKTDKDLVLATVYVYKGDEDAFHYKVQKTLPLSAFEEADMVHDFTFQCVTTETTVSARFCLKTVSFPTKALGYLYFDMDGKTVYLIMIATQEK